MTVNCETSVVPFASFEGGMPSDGLSMIALRNSPALWLEENA